MARLKKTKPNIALVANWDWVIYNFRLPLTNFLADNGYQVTLICPPGDYYHKMEALGFNLIPWTLTRRSVNLFSEIRAILALAKIYRQHNYDLVHHFTIKPILYGSIAARIAGQQVVLNNFTGLGFLFSGSRKAQLLRIIVLPFLRLFLNRNGTSTLFQNEDDRKLLSDLQVIQSVNTYVIPGTGVDPNSFPPRAKRPTNKTIVFMASRLLIDKGLRELVEAATLLTSKWDNIEFWVAGENDLGNPAHIPQEELDRWRAAGIVAFLGHRSDIRELLAEVDIAALPSYHEGVPLFLIEAAAAGLPIVATDIPGCAMVVEDGVNGYLVPKKNSQALAQAIDLLHKDQKLRARFGKQSQIIAKEKFNIRDINRRYLEIYQELGGMPI